MTHQEKSLLSQHPANDLVIDEKVTDLLIKLAEEAVLTRKISTVELEEVVERYRLIATGLGPYEGNYRCHRK